MVSRIRRGEASEFGWTSIAFVLLVWFGYVLATEDSHHTNLNYLVWKQGWSPKDWHRNYHLFLVDEGFQRRITGKPLAELKKKWFPDLIPFSKGTPLQMDISSYAPMKDSEMVWVGPILEGFKLKNGGYDGVVHYDKG